MAVTTAKAGDRFVLQGVTSDPAVTAPLGRKYYEVGAHYIGFDDDLAAPVIARAYFDPAKHTSFYGTRFDAFRYVGYCQIAQLSFRGVPIPPQVYGGLLGQRRPYLFGGDQYLFIDFMDPAQARANAIPLPLYPFNAKLVSGLITSTDDLYVHPRLNGSLFTHKLGYGAHQSLVASMAAEIAPGLVTPADVGEHLRAEGTRLVTIKPTKQDLAMAEPYQIALAFLMTQTPRGATAPPLAGLDPHLIAGQVIGPYALLTLPDAELFGPTLVIHCSDPDPAGDVEIHIDELSDYAMTALTAKTGSAALWRIKRHLDSRGLHPDGLEPPTGRGNSGLLAPPYAFAPDARPLQLTYWTCAVGVRSRDDAKVLSAVRWTAHFRFHQDTGEMVFSEITAPEEVHDFAWPLVHTAYKKALTAAEGQLIDTSNFTLAAMRRDDFKAGLKLTFD